MDNVRDNLSAAPSINEDSSSMTMEEQMSSSVRNNPRNRSQR
jgi:hypothetical protein